MTTEHPFASFVIVEAVYSGMTQLDFTAPHTVFSRLPNVSTLVASEPGGTVVSEGDLAFAGTMRLADVARCDLLFVPGGVAATEVINDLAFMAEIERLAAGASYLTSVCTGSLILGARRSFKRTSRGLPLGLARYAAPVRGRAR
jgi:putative intracellular protease/amidase